MYLVPHDYFRVNERKSELYKYLQLKEELQTLLEQIDVRYRGYFPKEIANIHDLESLCREAEAKVASMQERGGGTYESLDQKKERRTENKTLKKLYRIICNLCHDDKVDKLNTTDSVKAKLKELFLAGKSAYKAGDLGELRYVYDRVLHTLHGDDVESSATIQSQYRKAVEDSDDALIKELEVQIKTAVAELRRLKSHPLYTVLRLDTDKLYDDAKNTYRHLLLVKLAELQQTLQVLTSITNPPFRPTYFVFR